MSILRELSEGFIPLFSKTQEQLEKGYVRIEKRVARSARKVKRNLFFSFFQLLFFTAASICLLIGGIMFLSRYVALDLVLLGAGFIALYLGCLSLFLK